MKTKTKKSSKLLILSALFAFCMCFAMFTGGGAVTASAATTPYYTMPFDYTGTYAAYGMQQAATVSDTNVTSYTFGQYTKRTMALKLYGTSYSGTATATKGQYFTFNSVNIIADVGIATSGTQSRITSCRLTNASGTAIVNSTAASGKSLSTTLYSGTLADGSYTLTYTWYAIDYMASYPNYTSKTTSITFTTAFKIDATAPTVSGASTSTTYYKTSAFTVTASDSTSGLENLYVKTPSSSSYSAVGSSKTVSTSDVNGLYCFYAKDKAGNQSSTYYVYFDNTKPTGVIKNASGTTLTGAYTNSSFSYTASDGQSGISYLQYKTPSSSSWATYTSGTQIAASAANGTYQFRAVDKAGNISDTKTILLDTTKPVGVLYSGTTAVSSGAKSTASYIKYVASDALSGVQTAYVKKPDESSFASYTSGTQLTTNGTYSFYCTDKAGNTSDTVMISLDNTPPVVTLSKGDWGDTLSSGFTVSATDNIGGTKLYYKTPNGSFVQSTGTSVTIAKTQADGEYRFYAVDGYGNTSETYSVTLSVSEPEAQIIRASDGNQVCVIWTDSTCAGTLDGESYVNGTWIKAEGSHTFVLINAANRSSTYTFTIEHYYRISGVVECTCTSDGYTVYECDNCGDSYKANTTSAQGHDYVTTVTLPTCTERGFTTKTCGDCGESMIENYTDALGHTYGVWQLTKAATCTESGLRYTTCSACKDRYSEVIPALGHEYETEIIEPTCVDKGYEIHICSRCGEGYNDTFVAALGHDYQPLKAEPTCTEEGYVGQCCLRCSDTYKTEILKATGHDYVETYVNATCTEEGCVLHICLTCGYEYKTDIVKPTGHSLETNVLLAATCEEKGERYYGCTKCDYERIDEIPARGHNYELAEEENEEGIITRIYVCSICAKSYEQDLGAQYEKVSNYVEYLFEEYAPYMIWVFLATAGVWSIAMGIAVMIATKNEEKAKAKKMLINYGVGLIIIFGILVAVPYLVRGIAFLVT